MVDPSLTQASIIAFLKKNPNVVGQVGKEIREQYWMGTKYSYPNIRVALPQMVPMSEPNFSCRNTVADVTISILCYAEGDSSKEASILAGVVEKAMRDGYLPNFKTVVRLYPTRIIPPVQEGLRIWRAQVNAKSVIKEI